MRNEVKTKHHIKAKIVETIKQWITFRSINVREGNESLKVQWKV